MPEIHDEIEALLHQAEQAARDGLQGQALGNLDAAENLIGKLPPADKLYAKELTIKIWNNRGIVFKNMESFDESAACFSKALNMIDEDGELNPKLKVGVHLNLANLMSRKRQYNFALEHFQQALDSASIIPDAEAADIKCKIHNNLALFYCNFGERDKAQAELDKCLETKGGDEFHIDFELERRAWIRTNLGLIHSELADERELSDEAEADTLRRAALGFFREALDIYQHIGYSMMQARIMLNVAAVERRLGMKKEAVEILISARAIADKLRSERLKAMVLEKCINFHLVYGSSPFVGALDELFALLPKRLDPFAERTLRRIEDKARRAGQVELLKKIRRRLRSGEPTEGAKGEVDEPCKL
jgi:tetratricopeptide (TPR) repeat protein